MSITITGGDTVKKNILKAIKVTDKKSEEALRDIGNNLLRDSRNQAPLDTSTLIKSAKNKKEGKFKRVISYNTKYAIRMHEHPEYKFRNGRKGKYLEDPLKQLKNFYLRELWTRIKF